MKRTICVPMKVITIDTGQGTGRDRYQTREVPNIPPSDVKWKVLDAAKGYFEVEGDDAIVSGLPLAPAEYPGLYAKAVRVSDGAALSMPRFIDDKLGTIESGGKQYKQGSEYRWKQCLEDEKDAVELLPPRAVNDGTCIAEVNEGIPKDVGEIDAVLGVPENVVLERAELIAAKVVR